MEIMNPSKLPQRLFYLLTLIALAALAWFILDYHRQVAPPPPLPPALAGLAQSDQVSGPRAQLLLGRLHGVGLELEEAHMVTYGRQGEQLIVWLGGASTAKEAQQLYREMDHRMADTPFFSDRREIIIDGHRVVKVHGQGRRHYYWLVGRQNYWLEVEGADGRMAVRELLPGGPLSPSASSLQADW